MKLLVSLFLSVVCVQCIPLYEDGRGHYTEKRTSYTNGYSAALNLNLGGKVGYKDGIAVLETTNSIGPDFKHYNESVEKTFERPADATPPPPNSGSINGPQNGMLSQPSNAWAMPNNPWAMQNNPWGMQNNPWAMQNGPWVTQYNPWARPNNQWGMPNSQWSMPNNPSGMPNNQWGMSNSQWSMPNNPWGMPNNQWGVPTNPSNIPYNEWGMPNNPSGMPNNQLGISNYPRGRSRHLRYGESNGALNDTPNKMPQQNSSYGNSRSYGNSNAATADIV